MKVRRRGAVGFVFSLRYCQLRRGAARAGVGPLTTTLHFQFCSEQKTRSKAEALQHSFLGFVPALSLSPPPEYAHFRPTFSDVAGSQRGPTATRGWNAAVAAESTHARMPLFHMLEWQGENPAACHRRRRRGLEVGGGLAQQRQKSVARPAEKKTVKRQASETHWRRRRRRPDPACRLLPPPRVPPLLNLLLQSLALVEEHARGHGQRRRRRRRQLTWRLFQAERGRRERREGGGERRRKEDKGDRASSSGHWPVLPARRRRFSPSTPANDDAILREG